MLLVAERKVRLTEAAAARVLDLLRQLPIEIDDSDPGITVVLAAARRHDLSAYDAA